ncbi:MAG TPA: sugar ABC transporter ATP-binding protein [Solirubrobacterales bacterium]|jgi:ribose transport system ATP-binding protein
MTPVAERNGVGGTGLRVEGLTKAYGETQALAGVSFELRRGSIHALLGGNGSGKSTAVKILAGVERADRGELAVGDERIDARAMTPGRAREAGLRFVHQQASTFPSLTVAENLAIGHGFPHDALGRVRWRAVRRRSRAVLQRFGIDADPSTPLAELGPASRAMVAIARALQDQEGEADGILVLDEPTASLPAEEVRLLLAALQRYAAAGQTILYITHRLEEVLDVADTATILRNGEVVATVDRGSVDHESLVELIVGRRVEWGLSQRSGEDRAGEPVLRASGVCGGRVRDASFSLAAGEVVGVAGLLGSGRSTLLRVIFGATPLEAGELELDGSAVRRRTPREAMRAGIAYVPEDRLSEGAFPALSVAENLAITVPGRYFGRGRWQRRRERREACGLVDTYGIKAGSIDSSFASLSGGNQQKVVLARWMQRQPRLLLLDEPTQGVDMGARAEIWKLVRGAVRQGAAALVVSSDFEELARTCDRILVMREGRIAAELRGEEINEESIDRSTLTAEIHS